MQKNKALQHIHYILSYFPYILLCFAIFLYLILWILQRVDLIIYASTILLPSILASIILIINKKRQTPCSDIAWNLDVSQKTLFKMYGLCLCIMIIWLALGNRGLLQLLLMLIMYGIIIIQMCSKTPRSKIILIELMIITSALVLPQLFLPAYYYGDTDLLDHLHWASAIIESGNLLPYDVAYTYYAYPLYHVLIAITTIFTNFASNLSLYLVSTIPIICTIPLVYLLTRIFTKSDRVAIFASFFYALMPILLRNLITPAPRVMATAGFILILYLLFRDWGKSNAIIPYILIIIVTLYITLIHHAQLPLFYAAVFMLCIGSFLYHKKFFIGHLGGLITFLIITITYQIYNYLTKIVHLVRFNLLDSIQSGELGEVSTQTYATGSINLHTLLTLIASSVMIIFVVIGLYMLLTRVPSQKKIMILLPFSIILFVFYVPGIAEVSSTLIDSLQLLRFRLVMAPIFAIIMAVGCVYLYNILYRHSSRKIICRGIIICLCLLLVISSVFFGYSRDNEIFYNDIFEPKEFYYNTSDLSILLYIGNYVESESSFYAPRGYLNYYPSNSVFEKYGQAYYESEIGILPVFTTLNTDTKDIMYLIFPYQKYERIGLILTGADQKHYQIPADPEITAIFKNNMYSHNIIFENGNSNMYYKL